MLVLVGCSVNLPNPFGGSAAPPALPASAVDVNECQPVTALPCVDQAVQVSVPISSTGLALVYRSDRVPGRTAPPTADVRGQALGGWTLSVVHSYDTGAQLLLQGDGQRRRVTALQVQSGKYSGRLAIASADGRQVFVFDASGRQQATLDAVSGAVLLQFDRDSGGRLTRIHDRSGNVMGVQRDSTSVLDGLVLPGGAVVAASVGSDGYLAQVVQPGGRLDSFTYGKGGLMTSHTISGTAATFFAYDDRGLLTSITEPAGATEFLTRSAATGGYSITIQSSSGRAATYTVSKSGTNITRTIKDGAGTSEEVIGADGRRQLTLADGTRVMLQLGPDPRFGMQAPVAVKQTTVTPKDLIQVLAEQRQATVSDDPLVGVRLADTMRVDGQPYATAYDPGSRTLTTTDPTGVPSTWVLDALGRVQRSVQAGVASVYTYDSRGRITAIAVGSGAQQRTGRVAYDDSAAGVTVTDPAGNATTITVNAAGRPSVFAFPGNVQESLLYDPLGRLVELQSPGGGDHVLTYSSRGLLTSEWAPATARGAQGTSLTYDADGLTAAVGVGGQAGVPLQRDSAGRLTAVKSAEGVLSATFGQGSSVPLELSGPGGVQLARTVDGGLVTGETWSGPVSGQVSLTLDGQGRLIATTSAGTQVATPYDAAGRLSRTGDLALAYDPTSGLVGKETMGSLTTTITYDVFGQVATATTASGSTTVFKQSFVHDPDGRTVEVDETVAGTDQTHKFAYDAQARLVSETAGGSVRTYKYDADGNLVEVSGPQGGMQLSYDSADRLLRAGTTTFTYAADGSLASRHDLGGATRYTYDERGVLTAAVLPDGRHIQYVTDALGRQIGKRVNGTLVEGMLWAGQLPAAQLDATGAVVERFAYDSSGRPVEVLRDGKAYRILTDANGSVRLVVDSTSGAVAERIDYDAFGNVIADTNPGFQPFGFAGGLYDRDTGLVRIGRRDYDARSRRWTAPDPIGLAGGQANLYAYVDDDPINFRDPSGRYGAAVSATYGFGVQATGILGGEGGTIGIGAQNVDGHWGIYANVGQGLGADFGVSINANAGNIYSPSGDPSADWAGATQSTGGNIGPISGGYYQSPNLGNSNGDPSYQGFYGGVGAGAPGGGSTTTTNTVCLAGCGSSHGDPHYVSADGLAADYQGAGEFLALTSTKHDLDVQVRQQPRAASLQVSVNTAVAANVVGDRVGVYARDPNLPARPSLFVDGQPNFKLGLINLPHGGRLNVDVNTVVITWPDGTYLIVHKSPAANVEYWLAASRMGTVTGLWGAYTGDPSKDLVTRQGVVMTPPSNGQVGPSFGNSWRITQQESLFDDLPGQDVARYTNAAWGTAPATPDKLGQAARSRATILCQGAGLTGLSLTDCILDVGATGDPSFAAAEAATSSTRPQVPDQFYIEVGQSVTPNQPAPGAGAITRQGQTQVYRFYSDANRNIYVSTDSPCTGAPVLELFTPDHASVIESVGCNGDMGRVPLIAAGEYEIVASAIGGGTATYAFTVHSVPPDQEFDIHLGDHVNLDQPAAGAGNISFLGLRQLYTFSISESQVVYLEHEANCGQNLQYALVPRDLINGTHGSLTLCADWGRATVTPGTWTVEVQSSGRSTGTFAFALLAVPPDQHFSISIGTTVSPGHPAPGAGHIDAHGSRQLYDFKGTPGQVVHLNHTGGCGAQQQLEYRLTTPVQLDGDAGYLPLCSDLGDLKLPAGGSYTIEVRAQSDSGDFGFSLK